ncbi:MAG: type II toxin-antitoxin system YoeB family toxin [Chromatocurvus sp.]
MSGLGKPEPLKHKLSGLWSRRISQNAGAELGVPRFLHVDAKSL